MGDPVTVEWALDRGTSRVSIDGRTILDMPVRPRMVLGQTAEAVEAAIVDHERSRQGYLEVDHEGVTVYGEAEQAPLYRIEPRPGLESDE